MSRSNPVPVRDSRQPTKHSLPDSHAVSLGLQRRPAFFLEFLVSLSRFEKNSISWVSTLLVGHGTTVVNAYSIR
jgi:hypothetical protein